MALSACGPKPRPIEYGADPCDFCKMTIVDRWHAAELVTPKNKVFKFDAIECMIGYAESQPEAYETFALLLVSDYAQNGQLIPAKEAFYVVSPDLPSPMGGNLTGFGTEAGAINALTRKTGSVHTWQDLIQNKQSLLPLFGK